MAPTCCIAFWMETLTTHCVALRMRYIGPSLVSIAFELDPDTPLCLHHRPIRHPQLFSDFVLVSPELPHCTFSNINVIDCHPEFANVCQGRRPVVSLILRAPRHIWDLLEDSSPSTESPTSIVAVLGPLSGDTTSHSLVVPRPIGLTLNAPPHT